MKKRWELLCGAVLLVLWLIWGNSAVTVTRHTVESGDLPVSFSGLRIVQISDLHNASFGQGNCRLLHRLRKENPDIIVVTGDLVCYFRTDAEVALDFIREALKIAPVYYVTGNHESALKKEINVAAELEAIGAESLENEKICLERDGQRITLLGVMDPGFMPGNNRDNVAQVLSEQHSSDDGYTIVLSHRPEFFDVYVSAGVDLVFTGHVHGGQVRIPFIGGVFSQRQGFFPEYDAGIFTEGKTSMIVSRGLGNSRFPLRVNNPPEIVAVELKTAR